VVKIFLKASSVYGVATVLSKGATIFLLPVYTSYLSKGQLGTVDFLTAILAMLTMIVGLDLGNALAREYSEPGTPRRRRLLSSTTLWYSVIVFCGVGAAIWEFADRLYVLLFHESGAENVIRAAAVSFTLNGIYVVTSQQLRWMLAPLRYGIVSLSFTLASLIAAILYISYYSFGASGVFYGTATGSSVGIVIALWYCRREFDLEFDLNSLKQMLSFCIPILPSSIAVLTSMYVSRFIVESHLGIDQVGILGVATRLSGLAGLLMLGFGSALTPLIYANQHDPSTPRQLARIFQGFTAAATVGLSGIALFAPELLAIFTSSDYSSAVRPIALMAVGFVLSQMYIFAPGAWLQRRMWLVASINVGSAVLTVILNVVLVPWYGVWGAALANSLAGLINFLFHMALSQRLFYVPHLWRPIMLMAVILVVVTSVSSYLPVHVDLFGSLAKVFILFAIACGSFFVSGVNIKDSALSKTYVNKS
jgi:O-antigen/teichoic acid export membrane protein